MNKFKSLLGLKLEKQRPTPAPEIFIIAPNDKLSVKIENGVIEQYKLIRAGRRGELALRAATKNPTSVEESRSLNVKIGEVIWYTVSDSSEREDGTMVLSHNTRRLVVHLLTDGCVTMIGPQRL